MSALVGVSGSLIFTGPNSTESKAEQVLADMKM